MNNFLDLSIRDIGKPCLSCLKNILCLLFLIIFSLFLYYVFFQEGFSLLNNKENGDITDFHSIMIIFLTLALVWVAWIQLGSLNKTGKSDFLMRIDDRYGSEPIIKARAIIHRLYLSTKNDGEEISDEIHLKRMAGEIKKIGQGKDSSENSSKGSSEDFLYLLNFLDFLETIAYFANRNDISKNDVNELLGGSLTYYYKVFEPWIYYRRGKYKDSSYYFQLEKLVKKIEREK